MGAVPGPEKKGKGAEEGGEGVRWKGAKGGFRITKRASLRKINGTVVTWSKLAKVTQTIAAKRTRLKLE